MATQTTHYDPRTIGNLNRRYANELGWKLRYHQIKFLLGITKTLPEPMDFAHAVADWQSRNPPLKTDGLLGRNTWKRMSPLTRMNAPSMSPLPSWLRMNTKIGVKYKVPMRAQGLQPICWLACVAMMLSYKTRQPVAIASLPNVAGLSASTRSMGDQMRVMRGMGFREVFYTADLFSEEDLLSSLSRHGPLIAYLDAARLFTHTQTDSPHAVVITGLNAAKDICYINNPWGQTDEQRNVGLVLYALDKWKEKVGLRGVTLMSLP